MAWDIGGLEAPDITVDIPDITIGGGSLGGASVNTTAQRQKAVALVNSAEPILAQNLVDYNAGRLTAEQTAAKFDQVWTALVTQLQTLGGEGQRAIADRQAGGKYDWFGYYRPRAVPISAAVPSSGMVATQSSVLGGLLPAGMTGTNAIIGFMVIGLIVWIASRAGAFK